MRYIAALWALALMLAGPLPATADTTVALQAPVLVPLWGALAAGSGTNDNGLSMVAVSAVRNARSIGQAEELALAECARLGGKKCKVIDTFRNSCRSIVAARANGTVTWVVEKSAPAVMQACKNGGLDCPGPVRGGCVEDKIQ